MLELTTGVSPSNLGTEGLITGGGSVGFVIVDDVMEVM